MRLFGACAVVSFGFALAGCQPTVATADAGKAGAENAGETALTCNQSLSNTMPFTTEDTHDVITVRAIAAPPLSAKALEDDTSENGALCEQASLVYSIHSGTTGWPLYETIMPLAAMDVGALRPAPAELTDILQTVLTRTEVVSTERAPAADPENPGSSIATSLSDADYAALKDRKLPLLCYPSSVHDVTCVYPEPSGPESFDVKEMVVLTEN